jgi:AraC family transcriptional regulator of adaptative response / DNA-3-methyladenine glycosylase II
MLRDPDACYRLLLARDVRADGRFFTCVKTTGIYCRPICPARPPKPENCIFVPSAAAEQEAGFRPCLRCRPESAPDLGAWRGTSATVSRALALIESGALDDGDVDTLAGRLGVGERHLRRLFAKHLGAAPVTVAQTRRLLLAKQLIHDTALPMTDIALASGFGSLRRFNETFQQLYARPPGALRRSRGATRSGPISLRLAYRPPYDWQQILGFFAKRALAGIERVEDDVWSRVVATPKGLGTVAVRHDAAGHALVAVVDIPDLAYLPALVARIRRVFDLSADPAAIGAALSSDATLAGLVARRPGLRLPGVWDGFEAAIRAVLGQQVSVVAATRLAADLAARYGAPMNGAGPLTHAFPEPAALLEAEIGGMPKARAATIRAVARAACDDPRLFEPHRDLDAALAKLIALPGIGPWTANYVAMRGLGEADAFVVGDVAISAALGRAPWPEIVRRAEGWRPWRAYAAMHLWTSLGEETADAAAA